MVVYEIIIELELDSYGHNKFKNKWENVAHTSFCIVFNKMI